MLPREDNNLLTQIGPDKPMGKLMRRYWIPALLSKEIAEPDCPPVRVRLLGEDLIAFRDTRGRVGLLDEFCPHRRASLFFGRNEECGLRCRTREQHTKRQSPSHRLSVQRSRGDRLELSRTEGQDSPAAEL